MSACDVTGSQVQVRTHLLARALWRLWVGLRARPARPPSVPLLVALGSQTVLGRVACAGLGRVSRPKGSVARVVGRRGLGAKWGRGVLPKRARGANACALPGTAPRAPPRPGDGRTLAPAGGGWRSPTPERSRGRALHPRDPPAPPPRPSPYPPVAPSKRAHAPGRRAVAFGMCPVSLLLDRSLCAQPGRTLCQRISQSLRPPGLPSHQRHFGESGSPLGRIFYTHPEKSLMSVKKSALIYDFSLTHQNNIV